VKQAIVGLGLPALGAFALWIPNDQAFTEPVVISVCSSEVWTQRLAPLIATPDADQVAAALDPQTWDHPEVELTDPPDRARFEEASARIFERFGEEHDPVARVLDETARRVAHAPPVAASALLVAMATDGAGKSDEVLASIRYASPAESVASLEMRGLPQSYWDLS
jgi:hypothetical protein